MKFGRHFYMLLIGVKFGSTMFEANLKKYNFKYNLVNLSLKIFLRKIFKNMHLRHRKKDILCRHFYNNNK